jgi:hypothetical protein
LGRRWLGDTGAGKQAELRAGDGAAGGAGWRAGGAGVTTPPEIIPYYRLNHSIWSLSDNKEASR